MLLMRFGTIARFVPFDLHCSDSKKISVAFIRLDNTTTTRVISNDSLCAKHNNNHQRMVASHQSHRSCAVTAAARIIVGAALLVVAAIVVVTVPPIQVQVRNKAQPAISLFWTDFASSHAHVCLLHGNHIISTEILIEWKSSSIGQY
jgi:hypothetical protein